MDAPSCVVLLASFNGEAYIRSQITTILDQRSVDVRVLVRDDGSTDGTIAVVSHMASQDARVQHSVRARPSTTTPYRPPLRRPALSTAQ